VDLRPITEQDTLRQGVRPGTPSGRGRGHATREGGSGSERTEVAVPVAWAALREEFTRGVIRLPWYRPAHTGSRGSADMQFGACVPRPALVRRSVPAAALPIDC